MFEFVILHMDNMDNAFDNADNPRLFFDDFRKGYEAMMPWIDQGYDIGVRMYREDREK